MKPSTESGEASRSAWPGSSEGASLSSVRQSRYVDPGMWPASKTEWPVPSGRQRQSTMRRPGRLSSSASHSVEASSSGRAKPVKGSPGPRPYSRPVVSPFMSDADKLAAVRAALPSLSAAIQLNTGSAGPLPAEVATAMAELEGYERDFGRAQAAYWDEARQRMDEARAGVAAVLGGDLDEVAITHATTDGMNLGTWALDWREGGRAVSTCHEHPGGYGPLYMICDRFGVELAFAEFAGNAPDDEIVALFDRLVTPGTQLVSISHVLWTSGLVMPVRRIADIAHARGALVLVDGAQAAGAIPVSVRDLGVDLYAVPAQKWLLGPEGLGALWVRRELQGQLESTFASFFTFETSDSRGNRTLASDARRFQVTNYHRPSVLGMARALGWLTMYVGLDFVYRRGAQM